MMDSIYTASTRATWLEIDTGALVNNVAAINSFLAPSTRLMAVIKGNAYGHGAIAVARILAQAGVAWFAVATPGEGLELRAQGLTQPILVLGYTPPWVVDVALAQQLTLTVDDQSTVDVIAQAVTTFGQPTRIHVKVNTGMNRLGIQPGEVADFLCMVQNRPTLSVEGIFTHFATADQPDNPFFEEQYTRFQELLTILTVKQLRPPLAHAANSAATLWKPEAHFDMVRCGVALYGLCPSTDAASLPTSFRPALTWKAQVVHLTKLQPGESIGYGRAFVATKAMTVATIPVGYADGFPRTPGNWQTVLLHGQEVPLVGRVCMDQTMIDVSALVAQGKRVVVGDEVVLLGQQGECRLTAEEIARRTDTINYEVVSRILQRVPRLIV